MGSDLLVLQSYAEEDDDPECNDTYKRNHQPAVEVVFARQYSEPVDDVDSVSCRVEIPPRIGHALPSFSDPAVHSVEGAAYHYEGDERYDEERGMSCLIRAVQNRPRVENGFCPPHGYCICRGVVNRRSAEIPPQPVFVLEGPATDPIQESEHGLLL